MNHTQTQNWPQVPQMSLKEALPPLVLIGNREMLP